MSRNAPPAARMLRPAFGRGCLTVFALPFAAVGAWTGIWMITILVRIALAQSWEETPARILEAGLEGDDSVRATARYTYTFGGQAYTGTRVSFYNVADNIGSFQRDVHQELSRHVAPAGPDAAEALERDPRAPAGPLFRCYVNPHQPAEAVLYRAVRVPMLLFQLVFTLAFGGVGFGLLFGSRLAARRAARTAARARQFPGEPWKWRDDWAAGLLRADRSSARFLTFFALFWNAVSWPLAYFAVRDGVAQGHRIALLALLFPLVGSGLAVAALREFLRVRRFGGATLQLATQPGVIGGKLAGLVRIPAKIRPRAGFHLRLICVRRVTSGSGEDRRTDEVTVWEHEQVLATDALKDPTQTALPVLFAIPYGQPPTDPDSPTPVLWRLEVSAQNPGLDLRVRFELPVFVTAESAPDFQLDDAPLQPYRAAIDPGTELRTARVRIEQTARGTIFHFPPARFPGQALAVTLFALIWTGVVAGMAYARVKGNGPPWFFVGIFGFFDVFILWGFLDAWLGCGRIEVDRGVLRWRKGLFGLGSRGEMPAGQPLVLEVVRGAQSGNALRYHVAVRRPDGRSTKISREMPDQRSAEILQAELLRARGVAQ